MIIFLAVDKNYSIGYKGDLLVHLKNDLKRFKKYTLGNIVVMGRKTLDSLPSGKPLKGRINIVLTKDKNFKKEGAYVVNSIDELKEKVKELNPDKKMKVFLIGGGSLVDQLYDECNYAYITEIDKKFEKYDTFIPNIREDINWEIVAESDILKDDDLEYRYVEFQRINK